MKVWQTVQRESVYNFKDEEVNAKYPNVLTPTARKDFVTENKGVQRTSVSQISRLLAKTTTAIF